MLRIEKSSGTTESISVNSGLDQPNHANDVYYLLLGSNGTIVDYEDGKQTVTLEPDTGTHMMLTVYQLPGLVENPRTDAALAKLPVAKRDLANTYITPADAAQLLSKDPFISGESITGNPTRYQPAIPATMALKGPDCPGNSLPASAAISADTTTQGSFTGFVIEMGAKMSIADVFAPTFNIGFGKKITNETSDEVSAEFTLATDSYCTRGGVDLYIDTAIWHISRHSAPRRSVPGANHGMSANRPQPNVRRRRHVRFA